MSERPAHAQAGIPLRGNAGPRGRKLFKRLALLFAVAFACGTASGELLPGELDRFQQWWIRESHRLRQERRDARLDAAVDQYLDIAMNNQLQQAEMLKQIALAHPCFETESMFVKSTRPPAGTEGIFPGAWTSYFRSLRAIHAKWGVPYDASEEEAAIRRNRQIEIDEQRQREQLERNRRQRDAEWNRWRDGMLNNIRRSR